MDPSERGTLSYDDNLGKHVRWSDFLDPVSSKMGDDPDKHSLLPRLNMSDNLCNHMSPHDQHAVSQVWPLDNYNTQLLDNVHPPCWQDPKPHKSDGTYHYDMVVIGGGTGGLITAAGSAGVGAKVAMIEEHMLGGDW